MQELIKDPYFRVEVLSQMANPQLVAYCAMRQDYSDKFIYDLLDDMPSEEEAGHLLVKHLLKGGKGHFGPLEHPQIALNFGDFPHSVMQQMRTHRNVSFDVQCLSGDTIVRFTNKDGKFCKSKTIGELYDLWENGEKAIRVRNICGRHGEPPGTYRRDAKTRLKKLRIRSLDESSNTFVTNNLEQVVYTGINPVYRITLKDGKTLDCTQNHKILTPYGWRILGQLAVGSQVMVNGVPLANADKTYQNKEWLQEHFEKGLIPRQLAAIAGCSTEAIKKWAYHHNLTWEQKQWNKGTKYNIVISEAERERRRTSAPKCFGNKRLKGPEHPCWKNLPVEKRVYNWLKYEKTRILEEKGSLCSHCGGTQRLSVHHVQSVKERPDLAFDKENLIILCSPCHSRLHKSGQLNPLCSHPVEIISIEYLGLKPTYDLSMKAPHHNFVANGIVVHNSFRYTSDRILEAAKGELDIEQVFYLRPPGVYSDRQGKKYEYPCEQRIEDINFCYKAALRYESRIEQGLAEEHARGLIPFDVRQHWVMSGNARSIMHLLDIRGKFDVQPETRVMTEMMFEHFKAWMPQVAQWYEETRWRKALLAP